MDKLPFLKQAKAHHDSGGNVIQFLKGLDQSSANTVQDILISYDLQSGSYVTGYRQIREQKEAYCQAIIAVLSKLGTFASILEAGVGEATTLGRVVANLEKPVDHVLGFDISWSRIHYATGFLNEQHITNSQLFTGDLFQIPLADNSVDTVYTSHSVEPNGGRETDALAELYRVANKYLVLFEPSYELASDEARARMTHHGYVTTLVSSAEALGYTIVDHHLLDVSINPLNPTGVLVIEKNGMNATPATPFLACPYTKARLTEFDDVWFSPESLLAYPKVKGIPCLLPQNAVLATHFLDEYNDLLG